jgi:hypothetical protein
VPLSSLSLPARRLAALACSRSWDRGPRRRAPTAQAVDVTSPVVISEVYGGGGNTGATYQNDFIELYNNSEHRSTVDVVGAVRARPTGAELDQHTDPVHRAKSLYLHPGARGRYRRRSPRRGHRHDHHGRTAGRWRS